MSTPLTRLNREHSIAAHGATYGLSWGYCYAKCFCALDHFNSVEPDSHFGFWDEEPEFWQRLHYAEGWMVAIHLSPDPDHINTPQWTAHAFLLDPVEGEVIDPLQGKRALSDEGDAAAYRAWIPVYTATHSEIAEQDVPWAGGTVPDDDNPEMDLLPEMVAAKAEHLAHFQRVAEQLHQQRHGLLVTA